MKLGPMTKYYAGLIWRTSDVPGFKLFWLTQKYDAYFAINALMREYIYLKAGISARLIYQTSERANLTDAELILTTVEKKLKMIYDGVPNEDKYTWGSSYNELIERVNEYMATLPSRDLSAVQSLFVGHLSEQDAKYGELITHIDSLEFVNCIDDYILYRMAEYENKNSKDSVPVDVHVGYSIENELLANVIADAIWTTADPGGEILNNKLGKDFAADFFMNFILRDYMYLKAGIASRLVYEAADDKQYANIIMDKVLEILKDVYDAAPASAHGGTYDKLVKQLNEYKKAKSLQEVADIYFPHLNITLQVCSRGKLAKGINPIKFVTDVEDYMRGSFINFQKNNASYKSTGRSGCLSVVACFSLLIIIGLAFVCFE